MLEIEKLLEYEEDIVPLLEDMVPYGKEQVDFKKLRAESEVLKAMVRGYKDIDDLHSAGLKYIEVFRANGII